jgi:hypothetical protein
MSETAALPGLDPLYPWIEKVFPLPNGRKRSKRSAQDLAKRYNLPVVRVGWLTFVDPALAAERLRQAQLREQTLRGRGRPQSKTA